MKIQERPACKVAFQHAPADASACQHATPFGLRLSACQLFSLYAHEGSLPASVGFDARGDATGRLADVLRAADQREAAC